MRRWWPGIAALLPLILASCDYGLTEAEEELGVTAAQSTVRGHGRLARGQSARFDPAESPLARRAAPEFTDFSGVGTSSVDEPTPSNYPGLGVPIIKGDEP